MAVAAKSGGGKGGKGGKGGDEEEDNGLEEGMGDFSKVFDKFESQMEKLTKMKDAAEKGADPKAIKSMMDEMTKTTKIFEGLGTAGKALSKLLK